MGYKEELQKAKEYYQYRDQKAAEYFKSGGYKQYQKELKDMENKMISSPSLSEKDIASYRYTFNRYQNLLNLSGIQDNNSVKNLYNVVLSNANYHASSSADKFKIGESADNSLAGLNTSIEWLRNLSDSATDEEKKQLNEIINSYSKNYDDLKALSDSIREQRQLREQRDEEDSTAFWNKTASTVLSALAAMGGGENASNAMQVRETSEAEKGIAYDAEKKANQIRKEIQQNYEKYVPYLDHTSLKKLLDDGEKKGKEQDYLEEDYHQAYKFYHGTLAAEYRKNEEVEALAQKAGIAAAAKEDSDNIPGNNQKIDSIAAGYEPTRQELLNKLKELGYKGDEEELNDTVDTIIDQAKRDETQRQQDEVNAKVAEFASKNKFNAIVASAGTAVAGGIAKIPGAIYSAKKTIEGYSTYKPVTMDENSGAFFGSNITSTITNTVADNIKSDVWREAYTGAMSFADNVSRVAISAALGPAGEATSLAIMAASVMSDTALEMTKLGYDAKAAGTYAAVAAGAELLTEKFSIDTLLKSIPSGVDKKGFLIKVIKQFIAEGSEEGASDVINDIADVAIAMFTENDSQKTKEINTYMAQGLSYDEAYQKWSREHVKEYIKDMAMGGLSGGIMGAGYTGVNVGYNLAKNTSVYVAEQNQMIKDIKEEYKRQGKDITTSFAKTVASLRGNTSLDDTSTHQVYKNLIRNGLEHSDSKVQKQAAALYENFKNSGEVSRMKAGRLMNNINAANTNISKGVAINMLESAGADTRTIAAVNKAVAGDELTKKDIKVIRGSEAARNIISQLYTEATKRFGNPDGDTIILTEDSSDEEIEQAASALYGATFNIDMRTDYGRTFSSAASLRGENKIGSNGMSGFVRGFTNETGMSLKEYSLMFQKAYQMAKDGKSDEAILAAFRENFSSDEPIEELARLNAIEIAHTSAYYDSVAEEANKKAEEASDDDAEETDTETEADNSQNERLSDEAIEFGKQIINKASALASLSESEKETVYKNGGAIVESEQELTTEQAARISFYDYRGRQHGIVYRFVDTINADDTAKGSRKRNVITLRLDTVGDMTSAAGHELGHILKDRNEAEYLKLQNYVLNALSQKEGYNLEARAQRILDRYRENDRLRRERGEVVTKEFTYQDALDEITNNALFAVDVASEDFQKFVKENQDLWKKVLDFVKKMIEDIESFIKSLSGEFKDVNDVAEVKALRDDIEFMKHTAEQVDSILNQNENEVGKNENNTTESDSVQFILQDIKSARELDIYWDENNNSSIRKQMENHLEEINEMKPVTSVTIENFSKEYVVAELHRILSKNFGYKIETQQYGTFLFDKRAISAVDNYLKENESAAILASPYVIKRGKVISGHKNHKGKGNVSLLFAAPAILNEKIGNVGVAVLIGNKSRVHSVRVIAPDGKEFELLKTKDAEPLSFAGGNTKSAVSTAIGSASKDMIHQKSKNIKTEDEKFQLSDTAYMEAARNGDEEKAAEYVEQAAKERWGAYAGNDGKPKVFYHGTNNREEKSRWNSEKGQWDTEYSIFTVFKRNAGSPGHFFNEDIDNAGGYGSTLYPAYLRMNNPLIIDCKGQNYSEIEIDGQIKDTYEWAEFAKKKGYDGVIFKNISDGVDYAALSKTTDEAVVFKSSQIKSADPVTYDDNGEIIPLSERFSEDDDIRFQLSDNFEETRDLVAVHNVHETELLKSLQLGGMPMPSIAVMRAKESGANKGYGPVSLVFSKDTIDPEKNRNNKVYGGDVWSPVYPKIEYKVNEKKADEIYNRARNALSGKAAAYNKTILFDTSNIEEFLSRLGYEGTIERYANDYNTKQFFLVEQGEAPEKTIQREKKTEMSDADVEMSEFFIRRMKDELELDKTVFPREWYHRHGSRFDEVYTEYMRSLMPEITDEEIQHVFNNMKPVDRTRMRKTIYQYYHDGKTKTEVIDDVAGTQEIIDSKIDKRQYKEWLEDLFSDIIEKKGIRNDVDTFDSMGNRRSFEALHYEENLENVVRSMKSKDNGQSVFFNGTGIWAVAAKNYGTISELKEDAKSRLKTIPDEEMSDIKQSFGQRFNEIANALIEGKKSDNIFIDLDNAFGNVLEAVKEKKTKSGVLNDLKQYYGDNVTDSLVDDILDLIADVGNMPTAYFEAKPQRGVTFNEVYTAVIPDNASAELKSALDEAGVPFRTNESGNEEDRVRVINSLDEVKFQLSDTADDKETSAAHARIARNNEQTIKRLTKHVEALQKEVEKQKGELKLSKNYDHDSAKTPEIAAKLLKQFGATDLLSEQEERFIKQLDYLFDLIDESDLSGPGVSSDMILMAAVDAVKTIKSDIKQPADSGISEDRIEDFFDYFKGYTILDDKTADEVRSQYGSIKNANRVVPGINFTTKRTPGGTTLGQKWGEINESFPDIMNQVDDFWAPDGKVDEITPPSQPLVILELAQGLYKEQNKTESPFKADRIRERVYWSDNPSEVEMAAAEEDIENEFASRLINAYKDVAWKATFADKQAGKLNIQKIQFEQKLNRAKEKIAELSAAKSKLEYYKRMRNSEAKTRSEVEKAQRRESAGKLYQATQNAKFKDIQKARENQFSVVKGNHHTKEQTQKVAAHLKEKLHSSLSVEQIVDSAELDRLFSMFDERGSDYQESFLTHVAFVLADSIERGYTSAADNALLNFFRSDKTNAEKKTAFLSDAQLEKIKKVFGQSVNLNDYVSGLSFASELNIKKHGTKSLAQNWSTICKDSGAGTLGRVYETFYQSGTESVSECPEELMPFVLMDAWNEIQEQQKGTLYSGMESVASFEETALDVANAIMDDYFSIATKPSYKGIETLNNETLTLADHNRQMLKFSKNTAKTISAYRDFVGDRYSSQLQKEIAAAESDGKKVTKAKMATIRNKARNAKNIESYKHATQQRMENARESKRRTELLAKINKSLLEFARLGANATKEKHIPNGLVNAVKEFLSTIQGEGKNAERVNDYLSRINDAFTDETLSKKPEYESLMEEYSFAISTKLANVKQVIGDTKFSELNSAQLEEIWALSKMIAKCISNGNKSFVADKDATIEEIRSRLIAELENRKFRPKGENDILSGIKGFAVNDLKPVYFFNHLHSKTFNQLYKALRNGQDVWTVDIAEAKEFIDSCKEKYGYEKWETNKKQTFDLESGEKVALSLHHIMTLKALSERPAAMDHLLAGGIELEFGIESKRNFVSRIKNKKNNDTYTLTEKDIQNITGALSEEQLKYVKAMQGYLATEVSKKGNEVSRELYDIDLFNDKQYFPIRSSGKFTTMSEEQTVGQKKIKNSGFTKAITPHSSNPVILGEFNEIWAEHVNEMAMYHGFVLPLEDFQKVYGYYKVFTNDKGNDDVSIAGKASVSIRQMLSDRDNSYISKFLKDLNGGVKQENTITGKFVARTKKINTALNMSVAIQQPSAVGRAFMYIAPKYFLTSTGQGLRGIKNDTKLVEEMMKYAPCARVKDMGYFDVDTGKTAVEYLNDHNYTKLKNKAWAMIADGQYRDSILTVAPEIMDRITWTHIWAAAKNKVKAEEHLEGEALLKRAGEVFSECIDKTQVYDTVFSRSAHMRSTDNLAKMMTAYMAEPTTALNMIYDAIGQWRGGEQGKAYVAKAFSSVAVATVFNAILKSIISTARHGKKDKNWWESYTGEVVSNFLDDMIFLNNIPLVKDVYAKFHGWDIERTDITLVSDLYKAWKKDDYAGMALSIASIFGIPVKNVRKDYNAIKNAIAMLTNGTHTTKEETLRAFYEALSDSFLFDDIINKHGGHLFETSSSKYDTIYQLMKNGNEEEAQRRIELLKEAMLSEEKPKEGESEKEFAERMSEKFDKGLNNYIVKNMLQDKNIIEASHWLMQGDLSKTKSALNKVEGFSEELSEKAIYKILNAQVDKNNKTVKEDTLVAVDTKKTLEQNMLLNNYTVRRAAKASHNNDVAERTRLQESLIAQGYKQDDVVKATNALEKKMYPNKKKSSSGTNQKGVYKYSDVANALLSNDTKTASSVTNSLVKNYTKQGKSEKDVKKQIRNQITQAFRAQYYDASESRRREIEDMLRTTGAYNGDQHIYNATQKWLREEKKKREG